MPDVETSAALRSKRSGRNDLGGEQTQRPERKEMSAAPKKRSVKSRVRGFKREADPHPCWGRPKTQRKKQAYALCGTAVAWDQASEEGFAEITSGRSRWQQGAGGNLQDSSNEAKAEVEESQAGLAHESVRAKTEE